MNPEIQTSQITQPVWVPASPLHPPNHVPVMDINHPGPILIESMVDQPVPSPVPFLPPMYMDPYALSRNYYMSYHNNITSGLPDIQSNFQSNIRLCEVVQGVHSNVEIEEYLSLNGVGRGNVDIKRIMTERLLNIKLKRIKITLSEGGFRTKRGALHYMLGDIKVKAQKNKITDQHIRPHYTGTGTVYLEPTRNFYLLCEIHEDEPVIVDNGLWVASEDTVQTSSQMMQNLSSALFGGEGLFQTKCEGEGWLVIELPVPPEEVQIIRLDNEVLKVDGNFSILRKGEIKFTVTSPNKNIFHNSGDGLLQTFKGTGEVWLCPTLKSYPQVVVKDKGSSNTN
eukprot:TRINITY_DN3752_c0_g1_i1.p1 TRINITY_DN3752_c0_g1~~TRINITY_DN3752_c0_g1_i1.p1  ORF type:complete len:339 (+),score=51.21 TRINITY_DN3752_c0_g1_i1:150-1166(+)